MRLTALFAAVAMILGTAVSADPFTDQVISEFRELGFERIEVKNGPTQVKVEGIRGNREYEVVYDRATGRILKQEQRLADARDRGQDGVEIQQRNRDFVGRARGSSPVVNSTAAADPFTDRVINEFRQQGFERIEVKNGPNQVKVEGIRGNREFEVVYDRATGRILKQEQGLADARDRGQSGIEVQQRDRDFVGDDRRRAERDDDDEDRGRGRDRDDDDDRSGRNGGDDRDDDDDRSDRDNDRDDDDDDDEDDDDSSSDYD